MTTQPAPSIQPRTLTQQQYLSTAYEIVAELPGGKSIRLGFTARYNKRVLVELAQRHADEILPHIAEDAIWRYSAERGWQVGAVRIGKSGRTERECATLEGRV